MILENQRRTDFGAVTYRKNILALSADELTALRNAFEKVYAIQDDRGYQHHAGIHGLPLPIYCEHHNLLFLPWHRAYLYFFEKALQDQVEGVTLPYWDWTGAVAHQSGLPVAYTETHYTDAGGNQQSNPLYQARIAIRQRQTTRNPRPLAELQRLADYVAGAQTENTFETYSQALENPHDGLHLWVRGDMGEVPLAAYDPIFWAHHANIDRLWWKWQQTHQTATMPAAKEALAPFPMTVGQTLNIRVLGYDYVVGESFL